MQQKFFSAAALLMVASTISACNSTDGLYSQGPWGLTQVHRNYPEYSAPWGRRNVESVQYVAAEPIILQSEAVEIEATRFRRTSEARLEADIGPSPVTSSVDVLAPQDPVVTTSPVPVASEHQLSATNHTSDAPQPSPPGVFTAPQRASSYAGTWSARIGSSSCKVQLSTVPSLDLYKASTQGCSHEAVRNVNGWSFRENQIILFSRGQLVARLSGAEASLSGTLSGSGSAIAMSR